MLKLEEQERLTRVGPGTPMGALLRRYWMPALPSCDLASGQARRIRLLGEDLVVFRDAEGRPGLMAEACPHRGASLAQGEVDGEGIRCPYHGWKFAPDGRCLETPNEPEGSTLCDRVRTTAYRVQELGGLIFAYLGPDPAPLLPRFDLFLADNALRDIGVAELPCNWLQIMENSVDPTHVEWLHGHYFAHVERSTGRPSAPAYRKRQVKIGFDPFEFGIIKRRVLEGGSEKDDDWAVGHPLVFPHMLRLGGSSQHLFQIRVPVDDTHTRHFWYTCYFPPEGGEAPAQAVIPSYNVPWRDEAGEFLVDSVPGQDIMTWVTQGPIADRTREHLGAADQGIILLRKLLVEQLERVEQGLDPMGVVRDPERNRVIQLETERNRFQEGERLLADLFKAGHARFSPIKEQVQAMLAPAKP